MNESRIGWAEKLLKDLPTWIEEVDKLSQSVESWRLRHDTELDDDDMPKPMKSSLSAQPSTPRKASMESPQRHSNHRSSATGSRASRATSSRKMVVIHYDAGLQKQVESLVGRISVGRGYTRKGKMAARVSSLSAIHIDDGAEIPFNGDTASPLCRKRSNLDRSEGGLNKQVQPSTKSLNAVDSGLVEGQALCERIAHQLLRDGDCDNDLEALKSCFEGILSISMKEVESSNHQESERGTAKKQRCIGMSATATIMTTGSFTLDATMRSLDVEEEDDGVAELTFAPSNPFTDRAQMVVC